MDLSDWESPHSDESSNYSVNTRKAAFPQINSFDESLSSLSSMASSIMYTSTQPSHLLILTIKKEKNSVIF